MQSMKQIINKHNKHFLSRNACNANGNNNEDCNCRTKENCPLQGNCLVSNVIYKAEVSTVDDGERKNYIGMTANQFKQRYNNHTKSFPDKCYSKETELSNYI